MHMVRRADGQDVLFVLADLGEAYHDVAHRLGFEPVDGGLARRFPSDSPHLDRIYANFARSAEEMVLQRGGIRPVPWDRALDTALRLMDHQSIEHWLVGSAALAVRGLAVAPGDVDLVVDEAGAHRLAEALSGDLIEPLMAVEGWGARWRGRAFPGALVEWVGGVDDRHYWGAAARWETVTWRGYQLRIAPLEQALSDAEQRGLTEQARLIRHVMYGRGHDIRTQEEQV